MLDRWKGPRWFHAHETARMDVLNGLPLASFKRRAYAFMIDGVCQIFLKAPFAGLAFWHTMHFGNPSESLMKIYEEIDNLVLSGLYFSLALKWGKGQTPGKYLMKIKVVSLEHDGITWWTAIERALGYGASFLEGGFGFAQYYIHRNRMCVHDRIAETIVVDLRQSRKAPALKSAADAEASDIAN